MNLKTKDIKAVAVLLLFLAGIALFDVFNFTTSKAALEELLVTIKPVVVAGYSISVGTMLALAACFIDFGGLVRVFTPEKKFLDESVEIWLITAAWFFAAIFNAFLTWYVAYESLLQVRLPGILTGKVLPISISLAVFVFLVRIALISSFAFLGDTKFKSYRPAKVKTSKPNPLVGKAQELFKPKPKAKTKAKTTNSKPKKSTGLDLFPDFKLPDVNPFSLGGTVIDEEVSDGSWTEEEFINYYLGSPIASKKSNSELAKKAKVSEDTIAVWKLDNYL